MLSVRKLPATVLAVRQGHRPVRRLGDGRRHRAGRRGRRPDGPVAIHDAGGAVLAEGGTDAAGHASLGFLNRADPGPTSYTVSFAGSDAVDAAQGGLTVQTTQTNVDLAIDHPDTVKPGDSPTISLAVLGTPDKPTGAATIAVDGTQVAAGQLVDGALSGAAAALPAGEHTIAVSYAGDARFQANQATATLDRRGAAGESERRRRGGPAGGQPVPGRPRRRASTWPTSRPGCSRAARSPTGRCRSPRARPGRARGPACSRCSGGTRTTSPACSTTRRCRTPCSSTATSPSMRAACPTSPTDASTCPGTPRRPSSTRCPSATSSPGARRRTDTSVSAFSSCSDRCHLLLTRPGDGVPCPGGGARPIAPLLPVGRTGVERERDDGIDPPPEVVAAQGGGPRFVLAGSGRLVARGGPAADAPAVVLPLEVPVAEVARRALRRRRLGGAGSWRPSATGSPLARPICYRPRVVNDLGRQLGTDPARAPDSVDAGAHPMSVAPAVHRLVKRSGPVRPGPGCLMQTRRLARSTAPTAGASPGRQAWATGLRGTAVRATSATTPNLRLTTTTAADRIRGARPASDRRWMCVRRPSGAPRLNLLLETGLTTEHVGPLDTRCRATSRASPGELATSVAGCTQRARPRPLSAGRLHPHVERGIDASSGRRRPGGAGGTHFAWLRLRGRQREPRSIRGRPTLPDERAAAAGARTARRR